MEEHHHIVDFLRAVHQVRNAAASGTLQPEIWIERYKGLTQQLWGANSQGLSASRVYQTCWKVSQDILIRLRRVEGAKDTQSRNALFTEQDRDALERRMLDIQQRLNITTESLLLEEQSDSNLPKAFSEIKIDDTKRMADAGAAQSTQTATSLPTNPPDVASVPKPARGFNKSILQDFILESLTFKSMAFREQDIEQAHGTSFDWIFNNQAGDSHPSFSEWLSTTKLGNIYWITGKPGSGKSTLIRYLSSHRNTARLLHAWAGGPNVTTAGFYFWTSGSPEQRSQVGLLRSLLFQLLSTKPELIAEVLPQLWEKLAVMTSKQRVATTIEWSISELMAGFSTFMSKGLSDTKLCLFIDGLDEFDGDHQSIIHFFRGLAEGDQGHQIKICLSSRPWTVFERAFEYAVPNLKLQASNFEDMFRYTIDKLSSNENVRSAMVQETALARKLVQTTVEMASGVFLWVRLAVGELIRRSNHADTNMADMSHFVSTLPMDLDNLFEVLIFQNQSKKKLAETSRLFQLVRAREIVADFIQDDSATSMSLWELAFAMNGGSDDYSALQRTVKQEPEPIAVRRCDKTQSWALSSSVGLLEVHHRSGRGSTQRQPSLAEFSQKRVSYLHRTVRDWVILSPGDQVWRRLKRAGDVSEADVFDPHLRLLRSYILQMKYPLEEPEHHRRLDEWYPGIALALTHARHVERDPHKLQAQFIGEVEKTVSWYWHSRGPDETDHWARNSFGTYEERLGNKLVMPQPYLALCTRFGLQNYVIDALHKLAAEPPKSKDGHNGESRSEEPVLEETPLLYRAFEFFCSRQRTIYPLSSPSFVRELLEVGRKYAAHPTLPNLISGPNTPSWSSILLQKKQVTTWIMVLRHLRDAKRRGWIEPFDVDPTGTERWTAIVQCLIEQGADRHAIVRRDGWDPETTAKAVLGSGGLLDEFGDYWVAMRLLPLFEGVSGSTQAPDTTERPKVKQSRLEHIFASTSS